MRGAVVGSLPGALGIAAHCMAGDGMPPSRSAVALLLLFGGKLFCPSGTGTFTDVLRVRQSVAVTVDPAEKLEVLDESFMPIEQCGGGALGAFQGQRLIEAGSERRVGDIVGHYFQQLVAFVRQKRTGRDRPVDRDLDIDFQIRGRNARSIVDEITVAPTAMVGVLDPCSAGHAQISAFPDHSGTQVPCVDADPVVGRISHVGMRLGSRLHIRSHATVPQQIHGAHRIARITSAGVGDSSSMPSTVRAAGDKDTTFASRDHTPPPAEIKPGS